MSRHRNEEVFNFSAGGSCCGACSVGSQVRLHVYVGIWEDVLIPPSIKALAVTAVLATCFGAGWQVNGWRKDSATQAEALARAAQAAQAERENRATEHRRSTNVIEAQNAQARRAQALQAAANSARDESDRLRDDLHAARAELSSRSPDACADNAAAASRLFDAMEAGVTRLSERGAEIARAANGHASDTLTLQQAWPK